MSWIAQQVVVVVIQRFFVLEITAHRDFPANTRGQNNTRFFLSQEQYEFCYRAVQEYIDSMSEYYNFKWNATLLPGWLASVPGGFVPLSFAGDRASWKDCEPELLASVFD